MLIRAANYHRLNQNGGGGQPNSAAAAFLMNGGGYGSPESIELNTIPFHLGQEDILIPVSSSDNENLTKETSSNGQNGQNFEEPEDDEENEYIIINRILERAAAAAAESNPDSENYQKSRIYVQTYHKRVLVV